jgi:hypothetical protein
MSRRGRRGLAAASDDEDDEDASEAAAGFGGSRGSLTAASKVGDVAVAAAPCLDATALPLLHVACFYMGLDFY